MSEYRRRLKEDFSKVSSQYGELSAVQQDNYLNAYEFLTLHSFESLTTLNNKKAIDIGAGSGFGLKKLIHTHAELREFDWHMCDLSYGMLIENRLDNFKIVADAAQLPFKNASFRFVVSNFALHWSDNLFKALEEIIRITEDEGVILLSLPVQGSFSLLEKAWGEQGLPSPLHPMPDADLLEDQLDALSLIYSIQYRTLPLPLHTPQACFEWLKKTGVRRKNIPDNRMTKAQYRGIVNSISGQLASGHPLSFEMMDIVISK